MVRIVLLVLSVLTALVPTSSFISSSPRSARCVSCRATSDDPLFGVKTLVRSMQLNRGFKQAVADALAGDITGKEADILESSLKKAASAPVFMFTWSNSPACKGAVSALTRIGAEFEVLELDKPWSEGNPIRAVLGIHLGQTSVPMIFIGGKFIGGFNDGPSEDAPGLVPLAFDGRLRPMLVEAGSLPNNQ